MILFRPDRQIPTRHRLADDILVAPGTVEVAASLVSGAILVKMPHVGHSTYYEDPQFFNKTVLGFLTDEVY